MSIWEIVFLVSFGTMLLILVVGILAVKRRIILPARLEVAFIYAYLGSIVIIVFTGGGALATSFK